MIELKSAIRESRSALDGGAGMFSLEYISIAGRHFANTPEWEARLNVDGKGSATYFRRRGPGDSAEFPPGLFDGRLKREELVSFLDLLEMADIDSVVSDPPGPRDPVNVLRIILNGRLFEFTWGISRQPVPDTFEHLKDRLKTWTLDACPSPRWSLSLKAEPLQLNGSRVHTRLKVENQGKQSIWLAHPASPGLGPAFGLNLKYGEPVSVREGYTPVPSKPKVVGHQQTLLAVPEFVEVSPDRPFILEFSASIEEEAPHGWAGKFAYQHYLTEDAVAGLPVFNGALFTGEMKW